MRIFLFIQPSCWCFFFSLYQAFCNYFTDFKIYDLIIKEILPESDKGQQTTHESGEVSTESSALPEAESTERVKDKEEKDKSKELDREKEKEKENDKKGENEKDKLRSVEGTNLDALLQRLPGCVSRDLIDQLTVRISYCVLYLFLDCIVIFVVIIYYYCLFVELLDKILGGVLLSKFKIKSEKACEGFVQCTKDISGIVTILFTHGCHSLNLYEGCLVHSFADVGGGIQLLNK